MCTRVAVKSVRHGSFFISKGISDQISTALHFSISVSEFQRAFCKANCRVLDCLVLHKWTSLMSLKQSLNVAGSCDLLHL